MDHAPVQSERARTAPTAPLGPAATTGYCTTCGTAVPARYIERSGAVWLLRDCPDHGPDEARVWSDAADHAWVLGFAPTRSAPESPACCDPVAGEGFATVPARTGAVKVDSVTTDAAAPSKRCVAVVDVTDRCNLACSFCFASSDPTRPERPAATARSLLDTVLAKAGPIPIQLSGGEPTTRDDLPELVRYAGTLGFKHIEVNTNGIRIAREPGYAERLEAAGVSALYLQFDGFGAEVHGAIRGADLDAIKQEAIARARRAGLSVVLVPTVVPGVNEHQLGRIVAFALDNIDVVRGVNIQPVSRFGRFEAQTDRLDVGEVAELLATQTGFLKRKDLLPVPCCGPRCSSATLLFKGPTGPVPLTRFVKAQAYRELMATLDERALIQALAGDTAGAALGFDAARCCGAFVPPGAERLLPRTLAVSVTGFMEVANADQARLADCCIKVPTPAGELASFCAWNLTTKDGRYFLREGGDRWVRADIKGHEPSGAVARAEALVDPSTPRRPSARDATPGGGAAREPCCATPDEV